MGIAAVNNDIPRLQEPGKSVNNSSYDLSGREHKPDNSGMFKLDDHILQRYSRKRPPFGQLQPLLRVGIAYHKVMPMVQQIQCQVKTHLAQSDHAQFHCRSLLSRFL
ncbi:hypothetical protein D3C75_589560 [compost metagenome]